MTWPAPRPLATDNDPHVDWLARFVCYTTLFPNCLTSLTASGSLASAQMHAPLTIIPPLILGRMCRAVSVLAPLAAFNAKLSTGLFRLILVSHMPFRRCLLTHQNSLTVSFFYWHGAKIPCD